MASLVEATRVARCEPQTAEQSNACDYVKRLFGRAPVSVKFLQQDRKQQDVCIVTMQIDSDRKHELICAGGFLVGIPPWTKR